MNDQYQEKEFCITTNSIEIKKFKGNSMNYLTLNSTTRTKCTNSLKDKNTKANSRTNII